MDFVFWRAADVTKLGFAILTSNIRSVNEEFCEVSHQLFHHDLAMLFYRLLWVSLLSFLPIHMLPSSGKKFCLSRNRMHLWPTNVLPLVRIAQRTFATIAGCCAMKHFQHFLGLLTPSWRSKLERTLKIGALRSWQFPHSQPTHSNIRPHVLSTTKLRWNCKFRL